MFCIAECKDLLLNLFKKNYNCISLYFKRFSGTIVVLFNLLHPLATSKAVHDFKIGYL